MTLMETIVTALKAMGHSERLRIVALLSYGELTVSEIVKILGLSQPRVTQYIKSLEDAGVIDRVKEGSWVFSRLNRADRPMSELVSAVLSKLPVDSAVLTSDRRRLEDIRADRAVAADKFFTDVANDAGQLGDEYLPRQDIDMRVQKLLSADQYEFMIDLGTGTGRMLELMADRVSRGAGVDNSPEMLKVARHKLSSQDLGHLTVRMGDLTATPFSSGVADLVTIHQVLHYLDDPAEAIREAGRVLRTEGTVLIVDFASHNQEEFREKYAHRRLGFQDADINQWASENHISITNIEHIKTEVDKPDVKLWLCKKKTISA